MGIDVGGTKVAAGIVRSDGHIVARTRVPMVSCQSAADGLNAVLSAIRSLRAQADAILVADTIESIGVCSPGPLDPNAGVVLNPPNLPCWRNFPLAPELLRSLGLAVRLDNDANAAGLAEAIWGSGRGYSCVFYVTIGTGIGTAIVIDQEIHHGRTGAAGEGGHVIIDYKGPHCACGKRGCIEVFASGPAIAGRARTHLRSGRQSRLLELTGEKLDLLTSELVSQAAEENDPVATEVLSETYEFLACWLGNIIDLLEPDVIIIGGGVGHMLQSRLKNIQERLPAYCLNRCCTEIPLLPAHYAMDAGIAGAAALCLTPSSSQARKRTK